MVLCPYMVSLASAAMMVVEMVMATPVAMEEEWVLFCVTCCEVWVSFFITCSAVILYADWSIVVKPGAVHTQYRMSEFNIERQNSILPLGQQPRSDLQSYFKIF